MVLGFVPVIATLPAGRIPIVSHVVPLAERQELWHRAWQRLGEELAQGRQGFVVVPAIDATTPEDDPDALEPDADEAGAGGAAPSGQGADAAPRPPASVTELWSDLARRAPEETAVAGFASLRIVEAADEREEALVVALALREALEQPGSHVALVTPDRGLAERVAVELRRWDVEVDDSAGLPLGRWPAGSRPRSFIRPGPAPPRMRQPAFPSCRGRTAS